MDGPRLKTLFTKTDKISRTKDHAQTEKYFILNFQLYNQPDAQQKYFLYNKQLFIMSEYQFIPLNSSSCSLSTLPIRVSWFRFGLLIHFSIIFYNDIEIFVSEWKNSLLDKFLN